MKDCLTGVELIIADVLGVALGAALDDGRIVVDLNGSQVHWGAVLGLDHNDVPGNIMQDTLGLSTRHWATAVDAWMAQLHYEASQRERR